MSFNPKGQYIAPERKEFAAVKDGSTWKVRSFGYASPVGSDVLPEVRADCDSAEDNAHLFAAAPELRRVWALVPTELAESILAGESERSRELIQKAMTPKDAP